MDTAAVACELVKRIENAEPALQVKIDELAHRAGWGVMYAEAGLQWLYRIAALFERASKDVEQWPSKVPSRTGARNRLLGEVVGVIQTVKPDLSKEKSLPIAHELLLLWGVQAPSGRSKQFEAIKKNK